jgi:coenzyme PQQ precursor peptide PqqA
VTEWAAARRDQRDSNTQSQRHCARACAALAFAQWPDSGSITEEKIMAWTTPTLVEICMGLEINGYLPAEF